MKKTLICCLIATSFISISCLKEENRSYTTDKDLTGETKLEAEVVGCYSPLRTILVTRGYWEMTEVACDLMFISGAKAFNCNCDVSPSRPAAGSIIWQNGYAGVRNCNETIEDISVAVRNGNISEKTAAPLFAEAVVLRALYYYILTSTFGDVPFYTEKVTEQNRSSIACLPRMDAKATRDYLIDEVTHWIKTKKALPYIRTYDEGNYHFGAAVGLMVAAKMCLWNERWEDAIALIEDLESIYGSYADAPENFGRDYLLTEVTFKHRYVAESILEVSNVVEKYGLQTNGLVASISMPLRNKVPASASEAVEDDGEDSDEDYMDQSGNGVDFYAGIGIPELGGYSRTSSPVRPNTYLYRQLLPYDSADLRSGEYSNGATTPRGGSGVLAWRWSGYDLMNDPERTQRKVFFFWTSGTSQTRMTTASRPWIGNKFWAEGMYNSKDPNNYKFFRFADALLMKAEALLETGDFDGACKYLSVTRTRAGIGALTFANVNFNPEALMEEIRRERAKELIGEFQRKYDLVRWGIWYERTKTYNEGRYLQEFIRPYHRYWPIPAEQITYSGGALDNNEYMQ